MLQKNLILQTQVAFAFICCVVASNATEAHSSFVSFAAFTMRTSFRRPTTKQMTHHTTAAMLIISTLLASAAVAFAPPASLSAHLVPRSSAASPTCAASAAAESAGETAEQPTDANTTVNANVQANANAALLLLDETLRPDSDASKKIIDDITKLRQDNQQLAEACLDDLLYAVDDNTYDVFWTRLPGMTRFSRRARMASLTRVLELSIPPADEEEGGADDVESIKRRERRALAVLLRTVSKENEQKSTSRFRFLARPAIRRIERAAKRGAKESATLADMENRIPIGLETPKYDVVVRRKTYEVRQYQPYALATVGMSSNIRPNDEARKTTDAKVFHADNVWCVVVREPCWLSFRQEFPAVVDGHDQPGFYHQRRWKEGGEGNVLCDAVGFLGRGWRQGGTAASGR